MCFFGLISDLINITYLQNRNRKIPSLVTSEDDEAETTISSDEFATTTIPNEVTTNIFEDYRSGKETKFRYLYSKARIPDYRLRDGD